MKSRFAYVVLFFAAALAAQAESATPTADAVAAHAFDVAAGPAWDAARYFAFTFVLERDGKTAASFPQRYDRLTGDYRVSGLDPQGKTFEVIMDTNTKLGKAWVGGKPVSGDDLTQMLTLGYRRFQNDVFWLLMAFKMREEGVRRIYYATRNDACGHTWDVIQPVFQNGFGFSPSDQYLVWVNRDTGLVDSWDMKLTGSRPDEPPVTILFGDYRRAGGLLISTRRDIPSKKQTVRLEELRVLPEPPKGAFAP
jgi:hypothetical protein